MTWASLQSESLGEEMELRGVGRAGTQFLAVKPWNCTAVHPSYILDEYVYLCV